MIWGTGHHHPVNVNSGPVNVDEPTVKADIDSVSVAGASSAFIIVGVLVRRSPFYIVASGLEG